MVGDKSLLGAIKCSCPCSEIKQCPNIIRTPPNCLILYPDFRASKYPYLKEVPLLIGSVNMRYYRKKTFGELQKFLAFIIRSK